MATYLNEVNEFSMKVSNFETDERIDFVNEASKASERRRRWSSIAAFTGRKETDIQPTFLSLGSFSTSCDLEVTMRKLYYDGKSARDKVVTSQSSTSFIFSSMKASISIDPKVTQSWKMSFTFSSLWKRSSDC